MFLIVFDLDGTLIDSRKDLADSANQLIQELGGSHLPEEAIGRMVGEGAAVLVRRALSAARVPETSAALPRFLDIYDDRLLMHTRAYDGITEVLQSVRPYARLAVLTNKPARPSDRILVGLGLRELFEEVIGGDGPWPRKPDPASLLAMIERLGATQETTLLVGDSMIDRETAARASVQCSLAAYGFGYASLPPERITGDEWIANTPSELREVIERFLGLTA
ncbi:MAG TPA: HAD-IA family hydrolase [Vicinamibacterales bacterium]|jgi:phosphoglycolate phosphatase|nr:HAD-IA family hydrolase [Vicinamibacterales bacterium]